MRMMDLEQLAQRLQHRGRSYGVRSTLAVEIK